MYNIYFKWVYLYVIKLYAFCVLYVSEVKLNLCHPNDGNLNSIPLCVTNYVGIARILII